MGPRVTCTCSTCPQYPLLVVKGDSWGGRPSDETAKSEVVCHYRYFTIFLDDPSLIGLDFAVLRVSMWTNYFLTGPLTNKEVFFLILPKEKTLP